MPAARLDFLSTVLDANGNPAPNHAEKGVTFNRVFQLFQGALSANVPLDLSPISRIRMQVRSGYGRVLLLEASTDVGNGRIAISTQSGATRGQFVVAIPEAVMEAVKAGIYIYDLKAWYSSGESIRYFEGGFEIRDEVTTDV